MPLPRNIKDGEFSIKSWLRLLSGINRTWYDRDIVFGKKIATNIIDDNKVVFGFEFDFI